MEPAYARRVDTVALHADPDFDFAARCLLNGAAYGMADPEAVLRAIAPVPVGDRDAWFTALTSLGDRDHAIGDACAAAGHRVSARDAYLRAANARFAGFYYMLGTTEPERWASAWTAHRASTEAAFGHWDTPVVTVTATTSGFAMPVWVFTPRPPATRLLVLHNGFGAPLSDAVMTAVVDGVRRGWAVAAFDGPGQGRLLVHDAIAPVDDWGAVGRAVVDAAQAALDTNEIPVALLGVAGGSVLATLAAADDGRVQALACDPGVVRPIDDALGQLPDSVGAAWRSGDHTAAARAFAEAAADLDHAFAARKALEAWPGCDAVAMLDQLAGWEVTDAARALTIPTVIAEAQSAMGFVGQSRELAALVGGPVEVLTFTDAEGAGLDCEIGAPGLRAQCIFDALERALT